MKSQPCAVQAKSVKLLLSNLHAACISVQFSRTSRLKDSNIAENSEIVQCNNLKFHMCWRPWKLSLTLFTLIVWNHLLTHLHGMQLARNDFGTVEDSLCIEQVRDIPWAHEAAEKFLWSIINSPQGSYYHCPLPVLSSCHSSCKWRNWGEQDSWQQARGRKTAAPKIFYI